jgi:hypothetical protein
MARRGILDYVLGGAVGGLEGLAQQRAAEDEKKRLNDALIRQQGMDAMDRARFLREAGYRVAPPAYDTEDPAARSVLPPLEMPSAAPSSGARAGGALSAALSRGMGVDATQPSMSRPGFGAEPLSIASGVSSMTETFERAAPTRPAQEPVAASVDLPGNIKMRFNAPETAAQITARTMQEAQAKRNQELTQALSALTPDQRAQYEPLVRASFAGVPSNVLQSIMTPREGRARRTQLNEKTGQIVDLDTGETINAKGYVIPPDKEKADTPRFGEVTSLRKEFNTESRPYKTVNDALKIIERLGTKENPTPQDIQALIYAFVKVQDPTSVVRESEYANAANAIALADKLGNLQTMYLEGKRLTPTQRKDMVETARVLREEAMSRYAALADSYESTATSFGMDPRLVVPNRLDSTGKVPGGKKSLEEEFPDRAAQVKAARAAGHSDAKIREFLTKGR